MFAARVRAPGLALPPPPNSPSCPARTLRFGWSGVLHFELLNLFLVGCACTLVVLCFGQVVFFLFINLIFAVKFGPAQTRSWLSAIFIGTFAGACAPALDARRACPQGR